jgi:hypothetical protein
LGLAISNGSFRVAISHPLMTDGKTSTFRNAVFFEILDDEHRGTTWNVYTIARTFHTLQAKGIFITGCTKSLGQMEMLVTIKIN